MGMRRSWCSAPMAVLLATLIPWVAGAQEEDDPIGECPSEGECLDEYNVLMPWRWAGLEMGARVMATHQFSDLHMQSGLFFEPSLFLGRDWLFGVGAILGCGGGLWGDDHHGGFSMEAGGEARLLSPPFAEVLNVAVNGGATWLYGSTGNRAETLRAHADVGFRALQALTVSGSFYSLFGDFEQGGKKKSWALGYGLTMRYDFCSLSPICDRAPPRPELLDCTCDLLLAAADTCQEAQPQPDAHEALCQALDEALDARSHPACPREDSLSSYLRGALRALGVAETLVPCMADGGSQNPSHMGASGSGPTGKAIEWVHRLRHHHGLLRSGLIKGRQAGAAAAKRERELRRVARYAPYPVDLRHALGCADLGGATKVPSAPAADPSQTTSEPEETIVGSCPAIAETCPTGAPASCTPGDGTDP
jgi:hypothetical protein